MERVGIIQIAKANLVDDPYNKIQLQTELGKDFFIKGISSHLISELRKEGI